MTEYDICISYMYVVCSFVCKIDSHFLGGSCCYGQHVSDVWHMEGAHSTQWQLSLHSCRQLIEPVLHVPGNFVFEQNQ